MRKPLAALGAAVVILTSIPSAASAVTVERGTRAVADRAIPAVPVDVEATFENHLSYAYVDQIGQPIGPVRTILGGYTRAHERGAIYWDGSREVAAGVLRTDSPVAAKWRALGAEHSLLGLPRDGLSTSGPFPGATWIQQAFQRGVIQSSPKGSFEVHGAILEHQIDHGLYPPISVGQALTDETPLPRRAGAFNHFEGGSIYWSPSTGPKIVKGAIRDRWAAQGWENGYLGMPTSDELLTDSRAQPVVDGRYSTFEGGSVFWSAATGARAVRGAVLDRYVALNRNYGFLGYPTSEEYPISGGVRQDFQGGQLSYSWSTAAVTTSG